MPPIFVSTILQSVRKENLAHYFSYDVKLRLLAHSRSFLANQKARNAIVGAENLLNINSLTKHIDELRIVLSNQCVDILAINETKLDGSICDNEVTVEGYNIIRRDRLANGRSGGGICFYIRSNINYIIFCGRTW